MHGPRSNDDCSLLVKNAMEQLSRSSSRREECARQIRLAARLVRNYKESPPPTQSAQRAQFAKIAKALRDLDAAIPVDDHMLWPECLKLYQDDKDIDRSFPRNHLKPRSTRCHVVRRPIVTLRLQLNPAPAEYSGRIPTCPSRGGASRRRCSQ